MYQRLSAMTAVLSFLFSAFPLSSKTVKLKHFKVDLVTLPIKLLIEGKGKYRYFLQTDVGTPKNVLLSQM